MPTLRISDLTKQIDSLIAEYKALQGQAKFDDLSDLKLESETFVVRLRSAIERLAPPASTYAKEKDSIVTDRGYSTGHRIRLYVGILRALRADADEAWLEGMAELVHADTFNDFIEQASELFDKGYENAAAVVAGSVLEAHIRLLCQKFGSPIQLPSGQPMKADSMNAGLVKSSAYNVLQQKAVTGWLAIRNAAAHGDYNQYSRDQVSSMISSIRDFILAHPA